MALRQLFKQPLGQFFPKVLKESIKAEKFFHHFFSLKEEKLNILVKNIKEGFENFRYKKSERF